jgi:type III pantothenate kinase
MILTIDIGNTNTHVGIFKGKNLIKYTNLYTSPLNKTHAILKKFLGNHLINGVGISSVVPKINKFYKKYFIELFDLKPLFVNYKSKLPITIKVKNLKNVGSDRICNCVFGYEYYNRKENVLIIDSGTAITYDVVLKNGDFIGGSIAPGIKTISKSLNQYTSSLPLIEMNDLKITSSPIGRNTVEALSSGIIFSVIDSVDGMISRIKDFYNIDFRIILTGGDSEFIKPKLKNKIILKKYSVLEGINFILQISNGF